MKRIIRMVPVASGDATHVKIQLYYSKGGMNYFTYRTEARGFYLSVTPVSISKCGVCQTETTTAFSGVKECLLECSRFNQKSFDSFVVPEDRVKVLLDHVLAKNGIKIQEENAIAEVTVEDLENQGNELDRYPVDESQANANAGDAVLYELNGKKFEVITWNERADDHEPGFQTVNEMPEE